MARKLNPVIAGSKFGRLTVVGRAPSINKKRSAWQCQCDCGEMATVKDIYLKLGSTRSCGCLKRETRVRVGHENAIHGEARNGQESAEYFVWLCMKRRCDYPKNCSYKYYGGRGIKVCSRWRNSFSNFLSDMGRRPTPEHTIDRFPNNDGDYEPGNCRWATAKEQATNRRKPERLYANSRN